MSNRTWQQELSLLREQWIQTRAAAQAAVAAQAPAIEHIFAAAVQPAFAALETELAPYREVVLSGVFQYLNYDFGKAWESSILTSARRRPFAEVPLIPGAECGQIESEPDPLSDAVEHGKSTRSLGAGLATLLPSGTGTLNGADADNRADHDEVCYTFHVRLVPHRVIHYTQFRCADFETGDILATRGQVRAVATLTDLLSITQEDIIEHFLREWRQRLLE